MRKRQEEADCRELKKNKNSGMTCRDDEVTYMQRCYDYWGVV